MTVELGADCNVAHCAPISFGPTRYSPSRHLPSAVSFTVTTDLPPSGKKSRTRHTLGSALVSRSGGPNGKLLNGNVGSSRRGGRTEIGGPSLMTVGLRADRNVAHCAPISFGPTRCSPS